MIGLLVKPRENPQIVTYDDYKDIQKYVNGLFDAPFTYRSPNRDGDIVLYCNDDILLKDENQTFNFNVKNDDNSFVRGWMTTRVPIYGTVLFAASTDEGEDDDLTAEDIKYICDIYDWRYVREQYPKAVDVTNIEAVRRMLYD